MQFTQFDNHPFQNRHTSALASPLGQIFICGGSVIDYSLFSSVSFAILHACIGADRNPYAYRKPLDKRICQENCRQCPKHFHSLPSMLK